MKQKLLILDLDETLIYATETRLEHSPDFILFENTTQPYYVYKRPHLEAFLNFCFTSFEVAVWTSSSKDYARGVVENIFPSLQKPVFVWARDRCTYYRDANTYEFGWLKNLNKVKRLGYRLESVLILDDTPAKLAKHYGNLVPIKPFESDLLDEELKLVSKFLAKFANIENVRIIEKRFWRNAVLNRTY